MIFILIHNVFVICNYIIILFDLYVKTDYSILEVIVNKKALRSITKVQKKGPFTMLQKQKDKKKHVLMTLFLATLYLSTFTFGGGYVIVSLLKDKFVDHYHWIDEEEILDLVAIAQSSPGAIAVNKIAGIPGVLVSVFGAIIPPMVIISIISVFYTLFATNKIIAALLSGMKAGVGAVIASVVYDMGKNVVKTKDLMNIIIMIISFCASYFLDVNVIFIILSVGILGFVRTLIHEKKKEAHA